MVVLITGASHTGKTLLAQKLLQKYGFPYISLDLLKMGLIRSEYIPLKPEEDGPLQDCLWPIVREMIKTAIENRQNLIVEGCYIPFGWEEDFSKEYRMEIRYCCLVMSKRYIEKHFGDIKAYAGEIEKRKDDTWCTMEFLLAENARYFSLCQEYDYPYMLIDENYSVELDLETELK